MVLQEAGTLSESGIRALHNFITDVEAGIKYKDEYAAEIAKHRAYFGALGGVIIPSMPLPEGTSAIAKPYSPLNKMSNVQPVDAKRPFKHRVIREYPLPVILTQ